MRDYAQVSPRFWTGITGKALRGHQEAQIVAFYLMTCPGSHMIGMYPLALPTLCHETGLTIEGASKGLKRLIEGGFAHYDSAAEVVWVPEMARFQMGETLNVGKKGPDNRIAMTERELENYRHCSFFDSFIDKYEQPFKLKVARNKPRGLQAPSKALGSHEHEHEQEQDHEHEQEKASPRQAGSAEPSPLSVPTWEAYSTAYLKRYGTRPVRNATVNAQLLAVVRRIGAEEAPAVAAFYVSSMNEPEYLKKNHATGPLLAGCEGIRTAWATKKPVPNAVARPLRAGAPVAADTQSEHAADLAAARKAGP